MGDSYSQLAERFLAHYATLRGVVRQTLVDRQLAEHLGGPPARIADVGGGAGHQSIPLARRGYEVTILDPSEEMLGKAQQRVFTDHLGNDLPDSALLRDVVKLEWEAGRRDPYGAVARLIHLVGRKLPG